MKKHNSKILSYAIDKRVGWIRVFGKGITWKHKSFGLSFSQRNGYRKYFTLFNYYINLLK